MNAASAIHLSIFGMQPVVVHGSEELKRRTLPGLPPAICTSASE
ncbi:acyl-CoA dehydrogenase domain protein [Mycobacterium xenopi 3993]|nr:acyl-CoA dehydrogenase domain protein [Mycobacterium xenopi 3993]